MTKKRPARRKKRSASLRGRCAITGRFITVKEARRRRKTAIVETVRR